MRLINTRTLMLEEYYGDGIPKYAILSHTWDKEEVTFNDWKDKAAASRMAGYAKIKNACIQARLDSHSYLWVDTNCIDKSSSAELSEAINSMFEWYHNAAVCYAFLADVAPAGDNPDLRIPRAVEERIGKSRWFTRGWTLQELLAPSRLVFFAQDWSKIGTRNSMAENILEPITRIDWRYLTQKLPLAGASIAKRMSWLSRRVTTRVEDMAYCMLGIFDINMPLLYGEGSKAFVRLQEEIIKTFNDQTIFCWTWTPSVPSDWVSMLAPSADTFRQSGSFVQTNSSLVIENHYSMTNTGLSITLPVIQAWSYYLAVLNVKHESSYAGLCACVPVQGHLDSAILQENHIMERIACPEAPVFLFSRWVLSEKRLYIRSRPNSMSMSALHPQLSDSMAPPTTNFKYGFLLTMDNTQTFLDETLRHSRALKSKGGLYLLERTRDHIGVETYPPGLFNAAMSLIVLPDNPKDESAVLVRISLMRGNGCVLFLGLSPWSDSGSSGGSRKRHILCRVLQADAWGPREDARQRKDLHRLLKTELKTLASSFTKAIGKGFFAMIPDSRPMGSAGNISVVYVTSADDRFYRLSIWPDEDSDASDVDTCSNIPAMTGWDAGRGVRRE